MYYEEKRNCKPRKIVYPKLQSKQNKFLKRVSPRYSNPSKMPNQCRNISEMARTPAPKEVASSARASGVEGSSNPNVTLNFQSTRQNFVPSSVSRFLFFLPSLLTLNYKTHNPPCLSQPKQQLPPSAGSFSSSPTPPHY